MYIVPETDEDEMLLRRVHGVFLGSLVNEILRRVTSMCDPNDDSSSIDWDVQELIRIIVACLRNPLSEAVHAVLCTTLTLLLGNDPDNVTLARSLVIATVMRDITSHDTEDDTEGITVAMSRLRARGQGQQLRDAIWTLFTTFPELNSYHPDHTRILMGSVEGDSDKFASFQARIGSSLALSDRLLLKQTGIYSMVQKGAGPLRVNSTNKYQAHLCMTIAVNILKHDMHRPHTASLHRYFMHESAGWDMKHTLADVESLTDKQRADIGELGSKLYTGQLLPDIGCLDQTGGDHGKFYLLLAIELERRYGIRSPVFGLRPATVKIVILILYSESLRFHHVAAAAYLGRFHVSFSEPEITEGIKILNGAADTHCGFACDFLAKIYVGDIAPYGDIHCTDKRIIIQGIEINHTTAFAHIFNAVEYGNTDSLILLANMYGEGYGTHQSDELEMEILERASTECKSVFNQINAHMLIGKRLIRRHNFGKHYNRITLCANRAVQLAANIDDANIIAVTTAFQRDIRSCEYCNQTERCTKFCKCKTVKYCDSVCQAADWDKHKVACSKRK